jgi:hypothetical protein
MHYVKTKVKVVFVFEHHTMKTYVGVEVKLHAFLTSATGGGE